jgi:prepilin-type N-terminal cleavage/methylation domain-containing protein
LAWGAAIEVGRGHRRAAFTLIEILAVVAILALTAAVVLPNLGMLGQRALRDQAQELAAQIELARQRAIMTGTPHRLQIDLDQATFRLEWFTTEAAAFGEAPPPPPGEPDLFGQAPLDLSAPRRAERSFYPIPGMFGRIRELDPDVQFAGLETPEGWVTRGEVSVGFDRDGTASYTEIYLEDSSGRGISLDVMPLDDVVRIRDDA